MTINSSDPSDPPSFDLGWLKDPADREVAVAAFKRLRQAYASIPEVLTGPEPSPGQNVTSDEDILENI